MTYGTGTNGTGAGPHQARSIGGVTQTYDANGNLTSGMGRTIAWNNENLPSSVTSNGVTETYGYNADSLRVKKVRSGVTTIYLEGLWEQTSSGTTRRFYSLNGQVVAVRTNAGSTNTVSYLHGDHLGSISVTTTASGTAEPRQEFDPWGKVRSGGVTTTTRNYTGQILDDTGLLFYNARYYDPAIGRFISGDTVVPGSPSGTMNGVAITPLTVSFHEGGFLGKLNNENKAPFWFQMNGDARQQHGSPMGPANPQALNRYAYVQNNPLKYTDPSGHYIQYNYYQAKDALLKLEKALSLLESYANGDTLSDAEWSSLAFNIAAVIAGGVVGAALAIAGELLPILKALQGDALQMMIESYRWLHRQFVNFLLVARDDLSLHMTVYYSDRYVCDKSRSCRSRRDGGYINVSWKGFENQYFIGDGGSDTKKSVLKHFERYYGYAPESGNR